MQRICYSCSMQVIRPTITHWSKFVDLVTIIWLVIFVLGFFTSPSLEDTLRTVNIAILSIFVIDLGVSYWKVRSPSLFVRKHWLDILMVIPYFRVFRIARILRLARFIRIFKSVKAFRSVKLIRFGKVSMILHEIGDLVRTTKSRFVR